MCCNTVASVFWSKCKKSDLTHAQFEESMPTKQQQDGFGEKSSTLELVVDSNPKP